MLKGLSLSELASKIEANAAAKKDYIADTTDLEMVVDAEFTEVESPKTNGNMALVVKDVGRFPILKTAHEQIGDRIKIPRKYYERMQSEAPDLLCTNVNRWFRNDPERRMLRTLNGKNRAFLSNRYARIDDHEIANVALKELAQHPGIRVTSADVTERHLYIQAVTDRVQGEAKVGDVVQAGVMITNSEVGFGAGVVTPLIYRLVCKNGMACKDGRFRAFHIGKRVEDSEELWADDTKQADDRAVLLKMRDTIRACLDAALFAARVDKMNGLTTAKIAGNPVKAVELLAQTIGASETEQDSILRSLIEGSDLSAWGLLNAVTAQAHTATDYDKSVEFERAGGELLALPAPEWRKILDAE